MISKTILMISASDMSELNGPVVHFTEVADAFVSNGYKVLAIVPGAGRFHRKLQCNIKYLKRLIPLIPRNLSFQLELFCFLIRFIFKKNESIFYVRHSAYMLIPQILSFFSGIKCYVEINGIAKTHYKLTKKNIIYRSLVFFTEQVSVKLSNRVVVVSDGMKNELIKYHKLDEKKIAVISNGVNTNLYKKREADICTNKRCSINNLVYVGSLEKWQGIDLLAKAAAEIKKITTDFKIILIGSGSYEKEIKQYIADKNLTSYFQFLGEKKENHIIEILSKADIALLPIYSKDKIYHASFMKLYTYLSLKLPVIGPKVQQTDILEKYQCGIQVTPGNYTEFASAVIKLMNDKNLIRTMGENGRVLMEDSYDWKYLYRNILET